jgi:hypothetical protein
VSTATDGRLLYWDTKNLAAPVEEVVLMAGDDLVLGGCCMEYNPEVKEISEEQAWTGLLVNSHFFFSLTRSQFLALDSCVSLTFPSFFKKKTVVHSYTNILAAPFCCYAFLRP